MLEKNHIIVYNVNKYTFLCGGSMKKIGIIVNTQKKEYEESLKKVTDALLNRAEIFTNCDRTIDGVKRLDSEELFKIVDYMLIMGGDGTIISAASDCAKNNIPVLGINLGRIGFMTEIEPYAISDAVDKLLCGEYQTERRMMIMAQVKKDSKLIKECHALNDIVVSKAAGKRLVGIDLYSDNELVNRYIADGMILATPTGSTGYSISAGGPVVDPNMDLYVATPVCAHMLSVRSAVLSADKEILIKLNGEFEDSRAVVSSDGEAVCEISKNDEVVITRSQYELELVKIGKQSFYDTLIKKLS